MSVLLEILGYVGLLVLISAGTAYYLLYLQPRPEDTTAATVYAGDAYAIDDCGKEQRNGSGLSADEKPKSCTPSCGSDQWPAPLLAGCTESLPPEADDLRGLWQAEEGLVGHVERIEPCGNRLKRTCRLSAQVSG